MYKRIDTCIYIYIYVYKICLRQVRHQVSASPIVLQGFLFLHILTNCFISVQASFRSASTWILILGDLCLRALGRTGAFARACLVLLRAAWTGSSTSKSFGKKIGFGMLWPLTAANLKFFQPGHKTLVHHYNILPTSTTCSAFCVTSRSPGALLEKNSIVWMSFWVSFCAGSIFASHMRARLNE